VTLLPMENPINNNYPGGQLFLAPGRGESRYHELRGFQQALAHHDAEAAEKLGEEFVRICAYVSARAQQEFTTHVGTATVPTSSVVFGDDGSFGCFTFARYVPALLGIDDDRLMRDPWRDGVYIDRRRDVCFGWRFSYNGAVIYRGPRTADDWKNWRSFDRWWSSHT
jgi:hypothetical protein